MDPDLHDAPMYAQTLVWCAVTAVAMVLVILGVRALTELAEMLIYWLVFGA